MKTDKTTKRESGRLRVFLSYARADKLDVKKLSERLRLDHFEPWRDSESLKLGESWPQETLRAISDSDVVVVCLSPSSGKPGFLQREISTALAADVLIIPALLKRCDIPKELIHCQGVELFDEDGYQQLKARISDVSRLVRSYSPGGPVPIYARHYIKREEDEESLEALDGAPFTMLVRGPVQCGKASLLTRLQSKARELDIQTTWFDPSPYLAAKPQKGNPQTTMNARAARALCKQLHDEWNLDAPPQKSTIESIASWLMNTLAPTASQHRLLIIDDLASFGLAGVSWEQFIREVSNRRAGGVQISVAVGLTHSFGLDFELRRTRFGSIVYWFPKIELDWLDSQQVSELEKQVSGREPASDELYSLFAGQPYLTHAAAADVDFRDAVRRWIDEPVAVRARLVRTTQTYRRHLSALKLSILGPTLEADVETRNLLQTLGNAYSGQPPLHSDHRLFLESANLLDEAGNPSLMIYRLIVEDLLESFRR